MNTHTAAAVEPLLLSIADAKRVAGLGRTKLYDLIGSGDVVAKKAGRRTLVCAASLRGYVESLPAVEPKKGA